MVKELHLRTEVLPGGRIEVTDAELLVGQIVEIVVRPTEEPRRRSVLDILAEAPGHRLFKTAEEVKDYLGEEQASWDR